MQIDGQDAFDAVSTEFNQAASALVQRAGTLKSGKERDALMAKLRPEMDRVQVVFARLGSGVSGDDYIAGLEEVRAASQRLQALGVAPDRKGLFRRR